MTIAKRKKEKKKSEHSMPTKLKGSIIGQTNLGSDTDYFSRY